MSITGNGRIVGKVEERCEVSSANTGHVTQDRPLQPMVWGNVESISVAGVTSAHVGLDITIKLFSLHLNVHTCKNTGYVIAL